jgi:transcriptional regulator with XRE-family HTH domain
MNTDKAFRLIYEQLGIPDIELESRTGILRQTTHAWKTGRRRPKPYHIMAMAQLLKMHVEIEKPSKNKRDYKFVITKNKIDSNKSGRYQIATCSDGHKMIFETVIDTINSEVVSRQRKGVETYG